MLFGSFAFLIFPFKPDKALSSLLWFAVAAFFVAVIGFRYEVGGDWNNYKVMFELISKAPWPDAIWISDPGYSLLNILSARLGLGIVGVNTLSAAISMAGIVRFARLQRLPTLALFVAVPYLVIVILMGYVRQGIAIGILLFALPFLFQKRVVSFLLLSAAAVLFHKTAILALPLVFLISTKHKALVTIGFAAIGAATFFLFVSRFFLANWQNYVVDKMDSGGAGIRIAMNAVPAVLFLLFRKRTKMEDIERKTWRWCCWISIILIPLTPFMSTVVDRVALYLLPIQMVVFSQMPYFSRNSSTRSLIITIIVLGYLAVLLVWLNYALYAPAWVPYKAVFF
jgi:hypothetical protein